MSVASWSEGIIGAHLKAVVLRSKKVFPSRIPPADSDANARTVITAVVPSSPYQVFPAPSGPAGQRMSAMSLNPASVVLADVVTSAPLSGTGTREDEKGDAPAEKGTLGLFEPVREVVELPKSVMKEPEKNRLDCEAFVVMDDTSAAAPVRPSNGGADQEDDAVFQTATPRDGDVKRPPAHTFDPAWSQKSACTSPSGPPEPRAANDAVFGVYEATLLADTPPSEVKLPAT